MSCKQGQERLEHLPMVPTNGATIGVNTTKGGTKPACKSFEIRLDSLVRAYKQAKYGTCAMREADLALRKMLKSHAGACASRSHDKLVLKTKRMLEDRHKYRQGKLSKCEQQAMAEIDTKQRIMDDYLRRIQANRLIIAQKLQQIRGVKHTTEVLKTGKPFFEESKVDESVDDKLTEIELQLSILDDSPLFQ